MEKRIVSASELTESKLSKIIKSIPKWHYERITSAYWEHIPTGEYSEYEKMEFVVCSMPMVGMYPVELVKAQMMMGPAWVNPRDCKNAKPNIIKRIRKVDGGEEVLKAMADNMRPHKHVPERIKTDEWLELLELMCVIDDNPSCGDFTDEEWMDACKRFIEKSNRTFC